MNVYIDACVLLSIYDLSGPDLDEFKKISELVRAGKMDILISQQVEDEFWRNREGGVAIAVKQFRETKANLILPNLMKGYSDVEALRDAVKKSTAQ